MPIYNCSGHVDLASFIDFHVSIQHEVGLVFFQQEAYFEEAMLERQF